MSSSFFSFIFNARAVRDTLPLEDLIVGKWEVDETDALGLTLPGDGSTLTFEACENGVGRGSDFLAEDGSTCAFVYSIDTEKPGLNIEGTDDIAKGAYAGEWIVESYTRRRLKLRGHNLLGEVVLTLTK